MNKRILAALLAIIITVITPVTAIAESDGS